MTNSVSRVAWASKTPRVYNAVLALSLGVSFWGCVDPGGTFDEFSARVIDATVSDAFEGSLQDVSGRFHLGLNPLSMGTAIEFDARVVVEFLNDGTATMSIVAQPLNCRTEGRPCGVPALAAAGEVVRSEIGPVDANGAFTLVFAAAQVIDNLANPLSTNDITLESDGEQVGLSGNIVDADTFCGVPNGVANVGGAKVPLNTSTFAARRISEDEDLGELADPLLSCPN